MKKALLAALMLTTLGISQANAKSLEKENLSVNAKATTNSALCYYTVVTYCKQVENGCTVTYKITTTYLFCFPICVQKTRISSTPSGGGCSGGNNGGGTGGMG